MLKHVLVLAASLAVSTVVLAQKIDPADWVSPRLSTEVSVSPSKVENQFVVRAKVTDLTSSKVLATPMLVVAASQPAKVEMGSVGAVQLKMAFTVAADGKSATYTAEISRAGEVLSSQQATLAVGAGA